MNSLSLVIYLADVVTNINGLLGLLIPILTISVFLMIVGITLSYIPDCPYGAKISFKKLYYSVIPLILVGMFYVATPSRQTILLIAGSEFGEEVVTTPEAKELLEGVRQVIKSQLEQYTDVSDTKTDKDSK